MTNRVKPNFIVRELHLSECEKVRELWPEVNFEIPKYNNEILLKTDPKGIIVAQDVDSEKIIGVCNGINLTPELAFFSGFCVKPEYQGLGIGAEIWRKCIEHIGTDRNIALVSRAPMWTKYRDKSGFGIVAEKILLHFSGKPNLDNLIDSIDGISLQSINENNIESVVKYDTKVSKGLDREVMIRKISKTPETVNLVAINAKQEVLGYCVLWLTNKNRVLVQPLYADNKKVAELLIGKTCRLMPNIRDKGLIYFCWNNNQKSLDMAEKMELEFVIERRALFTKKIVEGDLDKTYCVITRCYLAI